MRDDTFTLHDKTEFLVEWHILRVHGFQVTWQRSGISTCQSDTQEYTSNTPALGTLDQRPTPRDTNAAPLYNDDAHSAYRFLPHQATALCLTHLEQGGQGTNAQKGTCP